MSKRKYKVAKPVDMRDVSKGIDYIQDTKGNTKIFKSKRGAIKYLSKLEYPLEKSQLKQIRDRVGDNSLGIYLELIKDNH